VYAAFTVFDGLFIQQKGQLPWLSIDVVVFYRVESHLNFGSKMYHFMSQVRRTVGGIKCPREKYSKSNTITVLVEINPGIDSNPI
jgi:hypothetical protein